VPVPRPLRQAGLVCQLPLGLQQLRVRRANRGAVRGQLRPRGVHRALIARGRLRERLRGVLERREVQRRRDRFGLRRLERPLRIVDRCKHALVYLPVPLARVILLGLQQRLELFHVGLDRVCQVGELERQQVRIGQTDHRRAGHLRKRPAVGEVGVEELRVVV